MEKKLQGIIDYHNDPLTQKKDKLNKPLLDDVKKARFLIEGYCSDMAPVVYEINKDEKPKLDLVETKPKIIS
jgi:hypothetical protein